MGSVTFTTSFKPSSGLIISVEELKAMYFYGIPMQARDGSVISDDVWRNYIMAAQQEVEKWLGIKLQKQIIAESLTYYRDEFVRFGYIRTTYPVNKPFKLEGRLGQIVQIQYPTDWMTSRRTNDGATYNRQIHIIPNGVSYSTSMVFNSVLPYAGLLSYEILPAYWQTQYCTGFDVVPMDLMNFVGKLAALNMLYVLSNLILMPGGVSSVSISIDGLSQSKSANSPYKTQIDGYIKDLEGMRDRLYTFYKGITLSVI